MSRCLYPVTGCAADIVLLDCGKPVTEGDTLLELCKFVRVTMTPVFEEGSEIKLKDAKGRPIVDQEGCGYLSHYDLEIEMGGITASSSAWLTGDRITPTGGAAFGRREDCPPWFSFRLWQELAGNGRKICDDGEQEYLIHWLPCVTNFRVTSSFDVAEDTVTRATLTAQAYPNGGTFGNGHWGEYTFNDLHPDGTGAAFDEEVHLYEPTSDIPPPDCPEDCALVPFDGIVQDGKKVAASSPSGSGSSGSSSSGSGSSSTIPAAA